MVQKTARGGSFAPFLFLNWIKCGRFCRLPRQKLPRAGKFYRAFMLLGTIVRDDVFRSRLTKES
jgi:hypothetical protein